MFFIRPANWLSTPKKQTPPPFFPPSRELAKEIIALLCQMPLDLTDLDFFSCSPNRGANCARGGPLRSRTFSNDNHGIHQALSLEAELNEPTPFTLDNSVHALGQCKEQDIHER